MEKWSVHKYNKLLLLPQLYCQTTKVIKWCLDLPMSMGSIFHKFISVMSYNAILTFQSVLGHLGWLAKWHGCEAKAGRDHSFSATWNHAKSILFSEIRVQTEAVWSSYTFHMDRPRFTHVQIAAVQVSEGDEDSSACWDGARSLLRALYFPSKWSFCCSTGPEAIFSLSPLMIQHHMMNLKESHWNIIRHAR